MSSSAADGTIMPPSCEISQNVLKNVTLDQSLNHKLAIDADVTGPVCALNVMSAGAGDVTGVGVDVTG